MKPYKMYFIYTALFSMLFLVRCTFLKISDNKIIASTPTQKQTEQLKKSYPPANTVTKVATPTTTKTKVVTRTKTPTKTLIPFVSYPTLHDEVYTQKLKEWYKNQQNCAFPCQWDIDLEKDNIISIWTTVHEIFPDKRCYEGGSDFQFSCLFSNHTFSQESGLPISGIQVFINNGNIEQIYLYGNYPNKNLSQVIKTLGYPDEVYVSHLIGGEGYAESLFLLIFNNANTVVEFNKVIQVKDYQTLNFCITADDYPNIDIYPEGKDIQLSDLSYNEVVPIKPFSEAVGQEFAEYYQENLSSDGTLCIVTSQKIW